MSKISNLAFDLGGVVIAQDFEAAIRGFESIGLRDARQQLDAFVQRGIFADLEAGRIDNAAFRDELSRMVGRQLTMQECYEAWHCYVGSVPQRNLDALLRLKQRGYRLCLLSNTNPFMMQWAESPAFSADGHPVSYYFDRLYLSYECRAMKPSSEIFRQMLDGQHATVAETLFIDDSPTNVAAAAQLGINTLCPQNNADWTAMVDDYLARH